MFTDKRYRIDDRIVSISQPHVRPIIRGKASVAVEFGAKLSVSVTNGFVFSERLDWDAYNEGNTLTDSLKRYKEKYGFYPQAVFADKSIEQEKTVISVNQEESDLVALSSEDQMEKRKRRLRSKHTATLVSRTKLRANLELEKENIHWIV